MCAVRGEPIHADRAALLIVDGIYVAGGAARHGDCHRTAHVFNGFCKHDVAAARGVDGDDRDFVRIDQNGLVIVVRAGLHIRRNRRGVRNPEHIEHQIEIRVIVDDNVRKIGVSVSGKRARRVQAAIVHGDGERARVIVVNRPEQHFFALNRIERAQVAVVVIIQSGGHDGAVLENVDLHARSRAAEVHLCAGGDIHACNEVALRIE